MSRALQPRPDLTVLVRQLELACESAGMADALDLDLAAAVLDEAGRFAYAELEPLNAQEHAGAPEVSDGRVRLSPDHIAAWQAFAGAGWLGLDTPEAIGGQGLTTVLAVAAQEVFDRSCAAFGMMGVSTRSAVSLIAAYADQPVKDEWLPMLLAGEWAATICISEVGAGSDVARIRTQARLDADGTWRVTGEKNWISFGDQDATARIGHCVLARTPEGISLFLVPNTWVGEDNGVCVRRIEEKLGLHLSPTCALGFEGARAILLGTEGRGLPQMFVMIANMRLNVGAMGLGIAAGACDVARSYARERLQGGREPVPVAIEEHQDVRRQIISMAARTEMTRALLYRTAALVDRTRAGDERAVGALVEWFLPIVKTLGAETGFAVASGAVQVLGGAGYTRDWPVEQSLRDVRVLSIFEGATGIQAQDLVHRRLVRDAGATLAQVIELANLSLDKCAPELRDRAVAVFEVLQTVGRILIDERERPTAIDAGATAFLALATEAALTWAAAELSAAAGEDPASRHLRACARAWLVGTQARAEFHASQVFAGEAETAVFGDLAPPG